MEPTSRRWNAHARICADGPCSAKRITPATEPSHRVVVVGTYRYTLRFVDDFEEDI
jgi:hypothetical protein